MGGERDQFLERVAFEVGMEEEDGAERQAAIRHRAKEDRELPCRTCDAQALLRRLAAHAELAHAVAEHRRIAGGSVALAGLELGEPGDGRGGAGALGGEGGGHAPVERFVRQMGE
jgi:hypothetical protein